MLAWFLRDPRFLTEGQRVSPVSGAAHWLRVKSEAAASAQPWDPDTPPAGWRTGCGTCGGTAAALGGLRGTARHREPADLQPPLQGAPPSLSSTLGSDICDEGPGRTAGDRTAQTYDRPSAPSFSLWGRRTQKPLGRKSSAGGGGVLGDFHFVMLFDPALSYPAPNRGSTNSSSREKE